MDNLIRKKRLAVSQRVKFGGFENFGPKSKSESILFKEKRRKVNF